MFKWKRTESDSTLEVNDTNDFYNAVADHYHLFYRDWQAAVDREGMTLRRILWQRKVKTVLDASCGSGTQTIGLAKQGFTVTAADINDAMLQKARENAQAYKVAEKITFVHAGFLELPGSVSGTFDAVLTKGNALPHLLTDDEIKTALRNFHKLLKPGGLLLIGMRDYDFLLEDRPRMIPGQFHEIAGEQHILFDVWDWDDGPPITVTFNKFIVSGSGNEYVTKKHAVKYRALRRDELMAMLAETGFSDVKIEQQQWELVYTATRA